MENLYEPKTSQFPIWDRESSIMPYVILICEITYLGIAKQYQAS